ncbi:uncharacterized protein LOC125141084 [Tachysurus fulvidraco]|uniref:uncharacterized protein LOC125141084 n=1 Tax=Tachysurus fulvidraco TaxID=1234273 RepID=UPI001FEF9840|nr:uncharacterized protein LOC125141084 [Tachysurus fulvidraco]
MKSKTKNSNFRSTVIDHVLAHGKKMREAGQRVQFNLSKFSVATIIRTFREENRVSMKQVYRVPFERNSERDKDLRYQYVQLKQGSIWRRRRRGWNRIGQRAIVEVSGHGGGNVTLCAAISNGTVLHRHATLGHITLTIFLHFFGMFCLNVSSRIISKQCILSMLWFGTISAFTVVSEYALELACDDRCGVLSSLDPAHERVPPPLPRKGQHCM